jgi:hypothetical protein
VSSGTYLGYRDRDADSEVGGFFNPEMGSLPNHVIAALEHGPQAEPVLLGFDEADLLLDDGHHDTETGYGRVRHGGIQVSVRTDMPGVSPAMWSWWFGWHGSDSRRYKLWHPRAHVSARWADGETDEYYLGRTSVIEEYIGSTYTKANISFVGPEKLGLSGGALVDSVAVCARLGSSDIPVDVGWFIHQIRPTGDGSEMRSRFWMGGRHVAVRKGNRLTDRIVRPIAEHQLPDPRDLMVHCAQEMNHLAGFLPALYERFSGR